MTITAKVIADSVSPEGKRLTTFQLRYPRFIHAEELTHRILETQPELIITEVIPDGLMYDQDLSRNASSSRAIPVERMIADIRRDPVIPVYWGSNKPGMQAGAELTGDALEMVKWRWLHSMELMIEQVEMMVEHGLHKQIANRILEPWAHINVVVTATEWANFFGLRAHPDAQPEIRELAEAMMAAMGQSDPALLAHGMWHLPYVDLKEDLLPLRNYYRDVLVPLGADPIQFFNTHLKEQDPTTGWCHEGAKMISVARCARVSYLTHDGRKTTVEEDLKLYEQLIINQPLHASPAEHQATPDKTEWVVNAETDNEERIYLNPELHGNLKGWIQYRKTLPNEFIPG